MNNYIVSAYAILASLLLYLAVTEVHFFPYVGLRSMLLRQWFQRQWFLIWAEPSRPWNRLAIKRNSNRLAKQLMKEIKEQQSKE
jgi:hypothetical protein